MNDTTKVLGPGLDATTRALARRIHELEEQIVTQHRAGNFQQSLYAAHTATYLRQFLAEFIGPTWHAIAAEEAS